MKPTQEQIDAALRYAHYKEKNFDFDKLQSYEKTPAFAMTTARILSAAYRSKCEEVEAMSKELRHIADLLDAHFSIGGSIAGLGTTNKARKLLETTP